MKKQSVAEKVTNILIQQKEKNFIFQKWDHLKSWYEFSGRWRSAKCSGASKLEDGGQTLSTNLNTLARSSLAFSDGATTLLHYRSSSLYRWCWSVGMVLIRMAGQLPRYLASIN